MRIATQSLRGAGIAFWIVFALALGVGGESALMGLPNLGGALMPGGFEAEAHSWPMADFVALTFSGPLRSYATSRGFRRYDLGYAGRHNTFRREHFPQLPSLSTIWALMLRTIVAP